MKKILTLLLLLCSVWITAQDFQIASTSVDWDDVDRGRTVGVEIYFPSDDGIAIADGEFPVIAFGHGFVMDAGAYQNIREYLVPRGYIMVFATTETGFSPNHGNFGGDIAFIANHISTQAEFADHLNGRTCFMGHSMGGGASFLAGGSNAVNCVVGLAPAETDPSAIMAASTIDAPTLVISGTGDAVTPPAEHHRPIYDGIEASNKFWVSIMGGAHCYYANSSGTCDLGESLSGGNITISREEQHQIMFDVMEPFLEKSLKEDCVNWSEYTTFIGAYDGISSLFSISLISNPGVPTVNEDTQIGLLTSSSAVTYQWYINGEPAGNEQTLDVSAAEMTFDYSVTVTYEDFCSFSTETGSYEVEMVVDGVEEWMAKLQVSPNPCADFIQLDLTGSTEGSNRVSIYNLAGVLVLEQDISSGTTLVDLAEWQSGIYLLTVSNKTAILSRQKFVKE